MTELIAVYIVYVALAVTALGIAFVARTVQRAYPTLRTWVSVAIGVLTLAFLLGGALLIVYGPVEINFIVSATQT